ncbi:FliO/MopB family protein [Mariniblastus fucicola]|uniref:Flagellar biosynthesis protein, FliO n=1 Tax=Mariniblastus fucicola TaxID=980251 RepID=A0A5B9PBS5_9BACT|nr:flagellar biosynthetic protein FliO [Mariniblastus fucicola]QEG24177.1 hypothetical protein MFFC18_40940 [Mariniblastus fucicola]
MKRKPQFFSPTALSLCVFVFGVTLANCNAQNLQTSSANQTQFYGQWSPPAETQQEVTPDPTKDRFRELFPPTKLQPIADRSASRYPLPQKPAPMVESLPKARPLQPISQNNFLQGSFSQEPSPGGDFARVNHHEASTAEAVMPLPKTNSNADWPPISESLDANQMVDGIKQESETALSGIVGSMQTSGKDFWSQFQANGGWGEKIASVFSGGDDRFRKVFGSLAVVIGGYLAFVWLMRKFNLSNNRGIPSEVIEVIGNAPFGPRKNLQLVRLGSKLLLLMSGPEGTHPVGEITDAAEVDYLISLCNGKGTKATRSVMSAVKKIGRGVAESSAPGRTLHPTSPGPSEKTFSASQLVQALESIQGSSRSNTVFEA